MKNLSGYCDYSACRKFNHRYITSKQKSIIFPDVSITVKNYDGTLIAGTGLNPTSITDTNIIAKRLFQREAIPEDFAELRVPAQMTITATFEQRGEMTEAEARAAAVDYFNSMLPKLRGKALETYIFNFTDWRAVMYRYPIPTTGTYIEITDFKASINGTALETSFTGRETAVLPHAYFTGFVPLPALSFKEEITNADLSITNRVIHADLLTATFTMPADFNITYHIEGGGSISDDVGIIVPGAAGPTPWDKGFTYYGQNTWLNSAYIYTR